MRKIISASEAKQISIETLNLTIDEIVKEIYSAAREGKFSVTFSDRLMNDYIAERLRDAKYSVSILHGNNQEITISWKLV